MPLGPPIAHRIARNILRNPNFIEAAVLLRDNPGDRNEYGEWVPGDTQEDATELVSLPITGQERKILPEGLRDEEVRKFYWLGDGVALRADKTDGYRVLLGALADEAEPHTFSAATRQEADTARDGQSADWLEQYQDDNALLTKLVIDGETTFESWNTFFDNWDPVPVYRAVVAARWDAFTEFIGMRLDPGMS